MRSTLSQHPREVNTWRAGVLARAQALGWSQNRLARRVGVHRGTLSRLLAGKMTAAPLRARVERALTRAERRRAAA